MFKTSSSGREGSIMEVIGTNKRYTAGADGTLDLPGSLCPGYSSETSVEEPAVDGLAEEVRVQQLLDLGTVASFYLQHLIHRQAEYSTRSSFSFAARVRFEHAGKLLSTAPSSQADRLSAWESRSWATLGIKEDVCTLPPDLFSTVYLELTSERTILICQHFWCRHYHPSSFHS